VLVYLAQLAEPVEVLKLATELLKNGVPDSQFDFVLGIILRAFESCADHNSHYAVPAIRDVLKAIAQLPAARFSSALVARIEETLVSKNIEPDYLLEWRFILCSAVGTASGCRTAWENAFSYYLHLRDIESFSKIARWARSNQRSLFTAMVNTLSDDFSVYFFVTTLGPHMII
jgi:hypothetical protein